MSLRLTGIASGRYPNWPKSGQETFQATVVATSPVKGSVCLQLNGTTSKQEWFGYGRFSVLGGTGAAAGVRASGIFSSYQVQSRFGPRIPLVAKLAMTLEHASLGAPRPLSAACRAAGKIASPSPTPGGTATAKATFDGFAFAPVSATALPAGTQIFPQGSTVSGTAGCGGDNNLFAVITYSGPNARTDGALFGPNGTVTLKGHPVHSGQNVLFLLASPPNGSYSLKLGFTGVNGPAFAPSLALARSC